MPRPLVNDVPLHVQQLGAGPDVLLVHGLASNLAFWYFGAAPLLAADHRVTAYDLRGHGLSGRPASGYSTRDQARDLLALVRHLGLRAPVVVGHSFGAAVALHAAALQPGALGMVVVADGHLPAAEATRPRDGGRSSAATRLRARGVDVPDDLPRVAQAVLAELDTRAVGPREATPALDLASTARSWEHWRTLRRTTRVVPEVFDGGLDETALAGLRCPVRAVYGERTTCAASLRALRRALPDMPVVTVAGAGHLLPLLDPERFVGILRGLLDESRAAALPEPAAGASRA